MAFLFVLALYFIPEKTYANVFDCPTNHPEFIFDTRTLIIPTVFIGEDDIYKNLYIEFIPGTSWDLGTYRILRADNIPQAVQCGGFTRSTECRRLENIMCQ